MPPTDSPGRASGIGSWPGTDVAETVRTTFGELGHPHLPYLPELPARGPGADLIGRGAALLVEMPVDLQPSGWRLVDHPGRDLARAQSWLRQDLDALAEVADGYSGPLKVSVTGPWTLASSMLLPRLERAVVDPGACRDLVASLAEGVRRHLAEVARMVPGAELVLQLDEPMLPSVLAGRLPTASGFGRLRAVEEPVAMQGIAAVVDAAREAGADQRIVHCCAPDVPVAGLVRTGLTGLSVDTTLLGRAGWEALAPAVEDGLSLWAGTVAATGAITATGVAADQVWTRWHKLGLELRLLGSVVITPTCGLAGAASPSDARARLTRAREAAAALAERAAEA